MLQCANPSIQSLNASCCKRLPLSHSIIFSKPLVKVTADPDYVSETPGMMGEASVDGMPVQHSTTMHTTFTYSLTPRAGQLRAERKLENLDEILLLEKLLSICGSSALCYIMLHLDLIFFIPPHFNHK